MDSLVDKCDNFSKINCIICGCDVSTLSVKDAIMTQEQIILLSLLLKKTPKSKSNLVFQQSTVKLICTLCSSSLNKIDVIQTKMDKLAQDRNQTVNFIEIQMEHQYGNGMHHLWIC